MSDPNLALLTAPDTSELRIAAAELKHIQDWQAENGIQYSQQQIPPLTPKKKFKDKFRGWLGKSKNKTGGEEQTADEQEEAEQELTALPVLTPTKKKHTEEVEKRVRPASAKSNKQCGTAGRIHGRPATERNRLKKKSPLLWEKVDEDTPDMPEKDHSKTIWSNG